MSRRFVDTLILGKSNSYGLTRDADILMQALRAGGVETDYATIRERGLLERLTGAKRARRIIHLERVHPGWTSAAAENLLVPNQERFPRRHLGRLRRMDRVLAKTRHASAIFAALGVPTDYLGFTSPDRRLANAAPNYGRFFHLAGGSTLKGTEDVLALWRSHPEWPELVLVQKAANAPGGIPANVRLISGYMDDAALQGLQNACGVHLCPSRSEGWGHHLIEALSVSAVTLTTDGPPMNEHVDAGCGILVPASRTEPRHLGTNYFVDPSALEKAVQTVLAMPVERKRAIGQAARARFEAIDEGFRVRVGSLLAEPTS